MAVQYNLPPWIKGAQTAQMYAHGFPLGLEAGQAAARIHQLQAQMQLEAQKAAIEAQHQQLAITLAQQREQRESIQKQQELEVQKSYHDQMAQLREQDIAEKQQKLDQAAQITARKYQAQATMQQRARQLMASDPKMTMPQAYIQASFENPGAGGESGIASLARAAADASGNQPQIPQSQTINVGGKNVPILYNAKTGHFQLVTATKDPLDNPKDLSVMIEKAKNQNSSPDVIAELENRQRKALGLSEKSPEPVPVEKPGFFKSLYNSVTGADEPATAPSMNNPGFTPGGSPEVPGLMDVFSKMQQPQADETTTGTSGESDQKDWGIPKGTIVRGFEYLGGDPHDKDSWDVLRGEELLPGEDQQIPEEAALPGED